MTAQRAGRPRHLAPTPFQEELVSAIIDRRDSITIYDLSQRFAMVASQVRYHVHQCRDRKWIPLGIVDDLLARSFRKTPKLAEARREAETGNKPPDPRIEIANKISKLLREDEHARRRLAQLIPRYVAATPWRHLLD